MKDEGGERTSDGSRETWKFVTSFEIDTLIKVTVSRGKHTIDNEELGLSSPSIL